MKWYKPEKDPHDITIPTRLAVLVLIAILFIVAKCAQNMTWGWTEP